MSKIATIIELIRILQPYLAQLLPLVKAIIDAIKQAKDDKPVVGAAPVDPAAVAEAVESLKAAGMSPDEAEDALK